jgi:peptidoglycan/LPS O-acetylase OafA/YrhL
MRRLNSLDGLRGLAVLLVFVYHVRQRQLTGGFVGVDVFFVLSGYLITALLLAEYDARHEISLPAFYARRALRLYPALVCVVVFATVTDHHYGLGHPLRDGVFSILYLTDFYGQWVPYYETLLHTWSLAVEEQFYLLWPVALIVALRRGWSLPRFVIAVIAASVVITAALGVPNLAARMQFLPTSHVAELGSGALLAILLRAREDAMVDRVSGARLAWACLVGIIACVAVLPNLWWAYPAATVVCVPLVAHLVTRQETALSRLLSVPPLLWLGRRSYGFYLWHYPILVWTKAAVDGTHAVFGFAVTLVATELSWRLVELPFLRMKRRFEPPRTAVAVAPAQTQALS